MPKKPDRTYAGHKAKWSTCTKCTLCECRSKIVLARGSIPTDVLVVGEAPGQSEDTIGKPFIDSSGKLLDEIIEEAEQMSSTKSKLFTNLVACIPKDPERAYKVTSPSRESIEACKPRLQELVDIAKPRAIIMAGRVSQKWCPKIIDYDFEFSLDVIHPSALLHMDVSQQGLAIQRTTIQIRDLFEELEK